MSGSDEVLAGAYGISHSFGGRKVLDDVSIELRRGEVSALLGPNGSGKTTLMKIIAGILQVSASSGLIRYRRVPASELPAYERARRVAYIGPELSAEFPMTAYEAVMLGRTCHGSGLLRRLSREDRDLAHWAMERARCWQLRERDLHTLSGGERQLVAIARALAQQAKVLLLDEALSKMDLHHQAQIGRLLRQLASEGWSILLVAHDVNLAAEWSDRCLLLKDGRPVAEGPVAEVLTEERLRQVYPDAGIHVGSNPMTAKPQIFFCKIKTLQ